MTWIATNPYDYFLPTPVVENPNFVYPAYVTSGTEPVPTGIPIGNPVTVSFHLGRIIGPGSVVGTWRVRTTDGWLIDQFFPHYPYQLGDFVYLLVCGTWCTDIGQRTYLPPTPPMP
jgi:hypothetical protein